MGGGAGLFGVHGPWLFVVGVAGVLFTDVHVVARRHPRGASTAITRPSFSSTCATA